jgi:hypothetical protein
MSATVDHLGAHKLVRILQRFKDAAGNEFEAGETGRIDRIDLDWKTFVCTIKLQQGGTIRDIVLHDPRSAAEGPRSGKMRDYFDVEGEEVVLPPRPGREQEDPGMPEGPAWYVAALELEKQDRLEEAEAIIRNAVQSQYFALSTADMYCFRWKRLLREGKNEAAEEAKQKAINFAWFLAAQATSGGEGAALSRERDSYLRSKGLL